MKNLFTPLQIRDLTLRNRIAVSPMQQYSSVDGFVNDWHIVHLGSRAVGGAGLVITEALPISLAGRWTKHDLGIWSDEHIEGLRRLETFIKAQGSAAVAQIGHSGAKASRNHPDEGFKMIKESEGGWKTESSVEKAFFSGMAQSIALSNKGIKRVVEEFQAAARRAIEAGFDSVEIHAAHGYLIHQFYSELVNNRTDEYGGSFDNRIRFFREVVIAVRQVLPKEKPLFVRISAVDYSDDEKAWTIEDSVRLAKILKKDGVDFITASAGGFVYVSSDKVIPNYQLSFAKKIKYEANILTGTVGMITKAAQANLIIENDEADLTLMAREYLRNPYFAINAALELGVDIDIPTQYRRFNICSQVIYILPTGHILNLYSTRFLSCDLNFKTKNAVRWSIGCHTSR